MSNLVSQAALKSTQRKQWGAAAAAWEQHEAWMETQMGTLSRFMLDAAGLAAGHNVLDVACGTGDPSSQAAARVMPGGKVTATDLAPEMVEAARRKHQRLGLDNVEAIVMDAERLELPSEAFDAVTCRFGLMFCPDPAAAASEMYRVLKPGGKLVVAVWDDAEKNPFFTAIAGVLADYMSAPPPGPKQPGPFRLAGTELATVLRTAGFAEPTTKAHDLKITFATPEEFFEVQSQLAAPLKAAIETLRPEKLEELRGRVEDVAKQHIVDGLVQFTATPLTAIATR